MNNFAKRSISATIFTAILVFGLIWDRLLFAALFLFILYYCLKEFYNISLSREFRLTKALAILTACSAFILVCGHCFYEWNASLTFLSLIPAFLIPIVALLEADTESISKLGLVYAGLVYIGLPISLSPYMMMDCGVFDGWLMLSIFILIWVSDVGAYCLGTLFGQKPNSRKLAPKISPKKSWCGFWSGVAFSVAAAAGLYFLGWLPFAIYHCVAIGVIASIGGVCGDLFESMWKRHFGVKDSGTIIPGHGGMLDRFDSALVAIPLVSLYLILAGLL